MTLDAKKSFVVCTNPFHSNHHQTATLHFLFSSLVNAIISSKVQLVPGSEVAEAFLNPPVKPLLKVYYFNVTNPEVREP